MNINQILKGSTITLPEITLCESTKVDISYMCQMFGYNPTIEIIKQNVTVPIVLQPFLEYKYNLLHEADCYSNIRINKKDINLQLEYDRIRLDCPPALIIPVCNLKYSVNNLVLVNKTDQPIDINLSFNVYIFNIDYRENIKKYRLICQINEYTIHQGLVDLNKENFNQILNGYVSENGKAIYI